MKLTKAEKTILDTFKTLTRFTNHQLQAHLLSELNRLASELDDCNEKKLLFRTPTKAIDIIAAAQKIRAQMKRLELTQ